MLNTTDKAPLIEQYRQEMFDRDQRSSMSAAKREGKRETALILKQSGVDYAIISKSTGLSEEEIASL